MLWKSYFVAICYCTNSIFCFSFVVSYVWQSDDCYIDEDGDDDDVDGDDAGCSDCSMTSASDKLHCRND